MRRTIITIVYLLFSFTSLTAQNTYDELEFHNKPLSDVLIALGSTAGYSILPDETITGTVSYRFSDTTFHEALKNLSLKYNFFYTESANNIISISRISADYDAETGLISVKANDVNIYNILNRISKTIKKTILYDPLPTERLTVNSEKVSVPKFIEILIMKYPEYSMVEDADYYFIKRKIERQGTSDDKKAASEAVRISEGNNYSLSLERGDLLTVLDELFRKADKEYVLLYKSSASLKDLEYNNKSFEELLKLLLIQTGGDYTINNDIYYIFDINRQDVLKQYKTSEYIQLEYISAEDVPSMLPNLLSSTSFYKIDKNKNGLVISGSMEEIKPLKDYILTIDKLIEGKIYKTFILDYISPELAVKSLPARLRSPEPMVNKETQSFTGLYTAAQESEIRDILSGIDIQTETNIITFKYLKAAEFLKNLPPSFSSDDFSETGSLSSLYFSGSKKSLEKLNGIIKEIDVPQPQIRYKLLVVQYQESNGLDHSFNVSNSLIEETENEEAAQGSVFLGQIGNLLSLNFDILSTFGYLFAVELNSAITDNTANVLADTTLHGLSGESVNFQNSSTYRYQELEVDEDGNITSSGVTSEISTGLFMKVTGWISGDDMITMEIESTLSKKGTSTGSSETSLPPTSERIINTHIRTPSGEPIIIGGLMQKETTAQIEKTPILGDIPLLGLLFQNRITKEENTELVIYIVPYLDLDIEDAASPETEINRLFYKFFDE